MNHHAAAAAYRTSSVENAPPIKIVRMLYEGAVRFLDRAAAETPGCPEYQTLLGRADAIVSELRCSLDHAPAPEVSRNLESLYIFVEEQIAAARMENDAERITAARRVLTTLLEGWEHVQVQPETSPGAEAA